MTELAVRSLYGYQFLGILPFVLSLLHVGLSATLFLSVIIGLFVIFCFSGNGGLRARMTPWPRRYGGWFAFGGIGTAVLGVMADWRGIEFVYFVCSFLPALGILAALLPNLHESRSKAA